MIKKMISKNFWGVWAVGAGIALITALMLWLPKFSQLPMGLNRDEAALGYNAYSLLKTGKDEWGKSWPISITSFGDQKLPGYTYFLIPLIAVFDLKIWVVRLPSLMAGLTVIVSLGLITLQLAKSIKLKPQIQMSLSFLSMIFTAISPWQMHFSRVAYETHLAMAFFLSGLTLFLFAIDTQNKIKQRLTLIFSGLLFSLTLLTYHSYQIFTPLFILCLLLFFNKKIFKLDRVGLVSAIVIGLCTILLLFSGGVIAANQVKSNGINPFTEKNLTDDVLDYRVPSRIPNFLEREVFNKFYSFTKLLGQNYLSTISGTFFFSHGSGHGDHNPGNGNNLHLFTAPLILFGIFALWDYRKEKAAKIVTAWLLLALLPSSLTINPQLEVRIGAVFPVLDLISAIGAIYILSLSKLKLRKLLIGLLIFVSIISAYGSNIFYTKISPKTAVDNSTYHRLAQILAKYQKEPGFVLTQSPTSSPYIWYLFENKIDPTQAQKSLQHFPPTEEGFIHVKQFENIFFESINWVDLEKRALQNTYVLVIKPEEFPREKWSDHTFVKLEEITDSHGKIVYEVWRYK